MLLKCAKRAAEMELLRCLLEEFSYRYLYHNSQVLTSKSAFQKIQLCRRMIWWLVSGFHEFFYVIDGR